MELDCSMLLKKNRNTNNIMEENRSEPTYRPQPDVRKLKRDFGSVIRKYREKAGITQKQLSLDLGYSAQACAWWEQNGSNPDLDIIAPLCRYLQIPIEEFFGMDATQDMLPPDEVEMLYLYRHMGEESKRALRFLMFDHLQTSIDMDLQRQEFERIMAETAAGQEQTLGKRKPGRPRKIPVQSE